MLRHDLIIVVVVFFAIAWCLQLLEISWNLKVLLKILEISWNLVDAPKNFTISNVIFTCQAIFSTLYIGKSRVNRITMISGTVMSMWRGPYTVVQYFHHDGGVTT